MDLCFVSVDENGRTYALAICIIFMYILIYIMHRMISNHTLFEDEEMDTKDKVKIEMD